MLDGLVQHKHHTPISAISVTWYQCLLNIKTQLNNRRIKLIIFMLGLRKYSEKYILRSNRISDFFTN